MNSTKAGRALLADILELAGAFHQVGSIRDHADPTDKTGWNVHGIETCEDVYCVDALVSGDAIAAIEAEAREQEQERIATTLAVLRYVPHSHEGEPCTACLRDGAIAAITERSTPE